MLRLGALMAGKLGVNLVIAAPGTISNTPLMQLLVRRDRFQRRIVPAQRVSFRPGAPFPPVVLVGSSSPLFALLLNALLLLADKSPPTKKTTRNMREQVYSGLRKG